MEIMAVFAAAGLANCEKSAALRLDAYLLPSIRTRSVCVEIGYKLFSLPLAAGQRKS
jgi:hypothetical protein